MNIYEQMSIKVKSSPAADIVVGLFVAHMGYTGQSPYKMRSRVATALYGLTMAEKQYFTNEVVRMGILPNEIQKAIEIFYGRIVRV